MGRAPGLGSTEDGDHVVEVAGQAALGERAELLAEELGEAVAGRLGAGGQPVAVGVGDRAANRIIREHLVGRQVDLHAREVASRAPRPAVVDPALDGVSSARRLVRLEPHLLARDLDPGGLVDALRDPREDRTQGVWLGGRALDEGEVEVLREAVRFEVALLEAGAALEHPVSVRAGSDAMPQRSQPST